MILGATGFIGKNIALYFSKKFKIKATYNKRVPFKNNNIEWIKCDLKSSKQINNLFNNIDIGTEDSILESKKKAQKIFIQ